ncbi:MAG: SRPBCC family protein [Nitrococcus sp.]|nr:SRPBCC family protein [Nitrococcus sp.]
MRAGYIIVLTLAGIFVLAGAAGFAMGSAWQVKVSGTVAAPPGEVIGYLADFHSWRQWSAWNARKFPESEFSYRGDSGSAGAEQVWKLGPTTTVWHLLEVKPNELIYWRQSNDGAVLDGHFQAESAEEGTRLTWTVSGNTGFNPYDRLIAWLYSDRVRSQLRAGLQGIQKHFDRT